MRVGIGSFVPSTTSTSMLDKRACLPLQHIIQRVLLNKQSCSYDQFCVFYHLYKTLNLTVMYGCTLQALRFFPSRTSIVVLLILHG